MEKREIFDQKNTSSNLSKSAVVKSHEEKDLIKYTKKINKLTVQSYRQLSTIQMVRTNED